MKLMIFYKNYQKKKMPELELGDRLLNSLGTSEKNYM